MFDGIALQVYGGRNSSRMRFPGILRRFAVCHIFPAPSKNMTMRRAEDPREHPPREAMRFDQTLRKRHITV